MESTEQLYTHATLWFSSFGFAERGTSCGQKKWQEGLGGKNGVTRATQMEEAESGSSGSRSSSSNCCKVMIGATK
jgi:hypothetical protein